MKDDRRDDPPRQPKAPRQSVRHDIWLWLCLYHYEKIDLDPATCNGITMGSSIARVLKRNPDLLEKINWEKDRFMVPDNRLKWIDGGERQYQWLLSRIEGITALRPHQGVPRGLVHLTGRNHLIAMLDLWDVDIADKADEIERLRNHWLRHKAKDSDFKWFENKEEGPQRCKCAWEWLQKNRLPPLSLRPPISNHQELLMFFDQAEYGPAEQKAIINEIKQRWHKRQHTARTAAAGKKQVNVGLSNTVISLLDELAEKHQLNRAQVLERLIVMESEQDMIERFSRHGSKEMAVETGSSIPTQPAHPQVIIDESPVAHPEPQSQQVLDAKPEPSSALVSDSASPLSSYPASENQEAQPNGNASPHLEADRPPQSTQPATPSPPSIGNRVRTLGDIVREQEEKEARDLEAKAGTD